MRTIHTSIRTVAPVLALLAGALAVNAGCSSNGSQSGSSASDPSTVAHASQASSATSDVTPINSFDVSSKPGSLVVVAKDQSGNEVATFDITKAPIAKYTSGVLPVTVIEETSPSGGAMHAETASVYPHRDDLTRTEFELFGVGADNLIIRTAFDATGTMSRISLFAFHGTFTDGQPRLGHFLTSAVAQAQPFDVPSSYVSIDEFVEAWIDNNNLAGVFNSSELDNVFFAIKDPTWVGAMVDSASADNTTVAVSDDGVSLENTGGSGSGGGGSGSGSGSDGGSGSSGSGTKSGSGGKAGSSKTPKTGQLSGCDKGGLGGFLGGIISGVAKNPVGAISGGKACKACATEALGGSSSTTTKTGTKTAKTTTKASATKAHVVAAAKTVKTPRKTSTSSTSCSTCQKFLGSTGVTKAASCLIGKAANGVFGSSKTGAATNSKGNSPADDMSDDCADGSCSSTASGNECTLGEDTCDFDPDQNADDSGNFDLGSDSGADFGMFDGD